MAITTPEIRISYPQVFTPKSINNSDPKYSVVLMFAKNNKDQMDCLKKLHAEATQVFNEKWPDPDKAPKIPLVNHDKSPIKDGDKNHNQQGIPLTEKNPEYAGHFIIRAATAQKPVIVNRNRQEILDANVIYRGCWCKVNINAFAYDWPMNKGVTFGLNGIQFWRDDESFGGGRPTLDDMFEVAASEDPASYATDDFFGTASQQQDKDIPF